MQRKRKGQQENDKFQFVEQLFRCAVGEGFTPPGNWAKQNCAPLGDP